VRPERVNKWQKTMTDMMMIMMMIIIIIIITTSGTEPS